MIRALFGILVLAACPASRPTTVTSPTTTPPAEVPADAAASTTDTPAAPPSDPPPVADPPPTSPPVTAAVPKVQPVPGTAAYCLYVGPDQRVVRCYWERKLCDEQIAFNKESGVDNSQECKGVAEAHCYEADKRDRCYPTADECATNVAGIRKQKRQASDCAVKTHP